MSRGKKVYNDIIIYKNANIEISKDKYNWILSETSGNTTKTYYHTIESLLHYLYLIRLNDILLKKGLIKVIESLDKFDRAMRQEASIIIDNIETIAKKFESEEHEN
jgi:hypothetical protein